MLTYFAELIAAKQVDVFLIFPQKEPNVSLPTLWVIPVEDRNTARDGDAERFAPA